MSEARTYLLLQGPMGSFFKKLASRLRQQGHRTVRVNFNGGDRLHFSSSHAIDFTGTLEEWPAFLDRLAERHAFTDLLLYNDCRPLHRLAIDRLKPRGVRIHVFEEGYFRPDWITLEPDGVNGFSPLPRDERFYRAQPDMPIEQRTRSLGSSFPSIVRHTVSYYLASALLAMRYRHYCSHRQRTYQTESVAWCWRLMENYAIARIPPLRRHWELPAGQPYFLVLLQLLGDSQITHHSPYHDMYEFLNEVLNDFAQHAPNDCWIVVKNHPLDNGLTRYGSFLKQKARSLGLGERLVFIDGGHLPSLLQGARGVVTVNSTAGMSALHHGIPVHPMGSAVYAIDGLVDRQPLQDFWHRPQAPDPALYRAFRHYVLQQAQVKGGYYTRLAIRTAVKGCVRRLKEKTPEMPEMAYPIPQDRIA